ncbi:MAG: hypothetical protein ABJC79_05095 [Acidimicrobiia bacterium]
MTFTALFGSEVRRLGARRAVRWSLVVALAIVMLVVVVATLRSTGLGVGDHTMRLSALWKREDGKVSSLLLAMSVYVFILVIGVAATAVGGDYRAGTMGTILVREPRRPRVVVARIGAVALVALVLCVVALGVFVGGWALGAAWRGSTAQLDPDFWTEVAKVFGRVALAAMTLAVITAGLAFVTRGTVGAVMIWFGYLIGIEAVLGQRVRVLQPGLLLGNFIAFVQGSDVHFPSQPRADGTIVERYAQPGPGLVRLLIIVAVVAGLGVLAFRRRDVS